MSKVIKYTLGIIAILILLVVAWFSYSYMNAKPVDRSLRDGGQSARNFMKHQLELQEKEKKQ